MDGKYENAGSAGPEKGCHQARPSRYYFFLSPIGNVDVIDGVVVGGLGPSLLPAANIL